MISQTAVIYLSDARWRLVPGCEFYWWFQRVKKLRIEASNCNGPKRQAAKVRFVWEIWGINQFFMTTVEISHIFSAKYFVKRVFCLIQSGNNVKDKSTRTLTTWVSNKLLLCSSSTMLFQCIIICIHLKLQLHYYNDKL